MARRRPEASAGAVVGWFGRRRRSPPAQRRRRTGDGCDTRARGFASSELRYATMRLRTLGGRRRRRFAGAEGGSRVSQDAPIGRRCKRVRAAKHAPCDRFRVLERRHGLAEIVERGAGVLVERRRVITPHLSV